MNYIGNQNQMSNILPFNNSSQINNMMNNFGTDIQLTNPSVNPLVNPLVNPSVNTNGFGNPINPSLLNGTNLDDSDNYIGINNASNPSDNKSLIKSLTKEIINNLRENNMSLYDNSSINSRNVQNQNDCQIDIDESGEINEINEINNDGGEDNNDDLDANSKRKKNKKKHIKNISESIENFVSDGEIPNKSDYTKWFFNECFNYKDFLVLFILYFILSQEMIKDFIAKYFSSLNPDSEGKVGVQGVIIYGLLLTTLFMIVRNLF